MDTLGSHPFLLGLKQVIQWNLESSNVVGWRCKEMHVYHWHFIKLWLIVVSDAVFLESAGKTFAADSVDLLINSLNFGHYELTKVATERSEPRNRVWLMDPYLSDQDMRDLLHLFPPKYRLEGRPSGDKYMTGLFRMNLIGLCDEPQPFFQRWCVLLWFCYRSYMTQLFSIRQVTVQQSIDAASSFPISKHASWPKICLANWFRYTV